MSPSSNTKKRRELIRELITKEKIATQEELAARLRGMGIKATQSTVSRDINALRLIKEGNGPDRHYVLPSLHSKLKQDDPLATLYRQIIKGADQTTNMIILHTESGMAGALCAVLDKLNWPEILGTLAGDDTVLLISRNVETAAELYRVFQDLK